MRVAMKPGPPKIPTALKLVNGNPGRRPLPKNEPKPPVSCPAPPEWLSDLARAEWMRVGPRLEEVGLMTDIDVGVLAAYCTAWADMVVAIDKQTGKSTVIKTHNGNWIQSPFVSMIRQARADMVRYAAEMGMTPASRAGLDINVGTSKPDTPSQQVAGGGTNYFDD
jgi:P27 family predicted phage terminase small subunit